MTVKRILLVDDEASILAVARVGLKRMGWSVLTAASGQEGIALAETEQPDAIVLDVMMPEMDGLATLKQLQDNPQVKDIPVIFLTAKTQKADRRRFYASGIKGFITKPFDPTTLASQISGFLGW
ncbi:response regulator receiver protein (plasmid) [Stanieria cyanosphaera PCC 7437]|uniref:Response regulator receiver protein n=1 Tax=Stanieria cyanosphaera (strain ATCC 29371 / PCC 7437) TaxID=111780 RepID=K9Y2A2_STAC7|nr:response regulator [Stanieria cyanosphaera]AFZ38112.1 response regulator receiver protein [Stanieria cyanosphaera PCC 7437]